MQNLDQVNGLLNEPITGVQSFALIAKVIQIEKKKTQLLTNSDRLNFASLVYNLLLF